MEELIRPLLASSNPTIATYAKPDGVHVRTSAKSGSLVEAKVLLDTLEPRVREALGRAIYGLDEESLAGVAGALLEQAGLTVATAEEFTGGLVASDLSEAAGGRFKGGLVSGAPPAGIAMDEEHGPGEARALALAQQAREQFGADLGLALAADLVPRQGATPGRRSYAALADATGSALSRYGRLDTTAPAIIRRRAVLYAHNLLREHLLDRLGA